jgi:hypothetical protein
MGTKQSQRELINEDGDRTGNYSRSFWNLILAQEVRNEVTVQGSGFFNKQTTGSGITYQPTNSGGVMAGYRFNLKNWLAVEGDYDYFRNGQKFLTSSGTTFIPMNVHAATGTAIVKLPSFKMP